MAIGIYIALLVLLVALGILARNEKLPPPPSVEAEAGKPAGAKARDAPSGIELHFMKMGAWIYRKCNRKRALLRSGMIRKDLQTMYPGSNGDASLEYYYIEKIKILLLFLFAGCLLSSFMFLSTLMENNIDEEGRVQRPEYEESTLRTTVEAQNESEESLGIYELEIKARQYTREQLDELFMNVSAEMESLVKGENETLEKVHSNLYLPGKVTGYPFSISWKISDHSYIYSDGSVREESQWEAPIPEEGSAVVLTATYTYEEYEYSQLIYVTILPPIRSEEELRKREMTALLEEAEEENKTQSFVKLPGKYGNASIQWKEVKEDSSYLIFILMIVAAIASYCAKDGELRKLVNERGEVLLKTYPQFVTQLVLYLGAGMTLRNVIIKLATDYTKRKEGGEDVNYLYEEICRMRFELEGGISEGEAIEHFGVRCRSQEYTRLCSLLSQNLKRGNTELLPLLKEEAEKATTQRLDHARKAGETAGTKLLMPMMMMLAVVMVLIMVPAYMSF